MRTNTLPASSRLEFRLWGENDLAMAQQLWGDPLVTKLIRRKPLAPEAVRKRFASELEYQQLHGYCYWPVFLRGVGTFAGCAGLHPRDDEPELGFHLVPDAWGQGLATEAARAVVSHAFDVLKVHGVFAGHHPDNHASGRVLAKIGFVFTHHELFAPTGLHHPSYRLTRREFRG